MRTSKELREVAEDLEALDIPYDDPCNFPDIEPQARCLYNDCVEPGRPTGYSALPGNVSCISFSRKKYPLGSQALESVLADREKFVWVDERLYWTERHWFLRVVFRDGEKTRP